MSEIPYRNYRIPCTCPKVFAPYPVGSRRQFGPGSRWVDLRPTYRTFIGPISGARNGSVRCLVARETLSEHVVSRVLAPKYLPGLAILKSMCAPPTATLGPRAWGGGWGWGHICEATTVASRLSDHKAMTMLSLYCQWSCGWYKLLQSDRDKVHLNPRELVVESVPGFDNLQVFWRLIGVIFHMSKTKKQDQIRNKGMTCYVHISIRLAMHLWSIGSVRCRDLGQHFVTFLHVQFSQGCQYVSNDK